MTRRHPAQSTRIITAGLSAATMLGIVAALGAGPAPAAPRPLPAPTAKVTVTVRAPPTQRPTATTRRATPTSRGARRSLRPPARRAPDTTTAPS